MVVGIGRTVGCNLDTDKDKSKRVSTRFRQCPVSWIVKSPQRNSEGSLRRRSALHSPLVTGCGLRTCFPVRPRRQAGQYTPNFRIGRAFARIRFRTQSGRAINVATMLAALKCSKQLIKGENYLIFGQYKLGRKAGHDFSPSCRQN